MGIDAGFDLFPPIARGDASDIARWERFLSAVKVKYKDDPVVVVRDNGDIEVTQGEHPTLLKEGHKFRRFSSKVSGSHAERVKNYLDDIYNLARQPHHFAGRVRWWSEYGWEGEPAPVYDWSEVYAAMKEV